MTTLRTPHALTAFAAACTMIASLVVAPAVAHAADTPYDSDEITINSQGHVDAPKIFWNPQAGTFILNGKGDILRPLHKTMNYLSKVVTSNTQEYYYTIPSDPRQKFLGEEGGHLFWAPNNIMPRSSQLWIGFGAEANIPVERFRDSSFTLDMVGFEGPGRMELFTSTIDDEDMLDFPVARMLSSHTPSLRSAWIKPGMHTHNHTTFTQPGRYKVTYRASTRLKNGELLASAPQSVYWQVGGKNPAEASPDTVVERYNAASTNISDSSDFDPLFVVKPVSDAAPKLTELSFFTGDTHDTGSAVFYVNGYFLTEVPVVAGRAAWTELIGPEDADLQVVYIPSAESTSPRWVSKPISYAQGDLEDSTKTLGDFPSPKADPTLTPFTFGDRTVNDPAVNITFTPGEDGYTITTAPAATDLPFRVLGGFYTKPTDRFPTCSFDFVSYPGNRSYRVSADECSTVNHFKAHLIPDSLSPVGGVETTGDISEGSGPKSVDTAFARTPYVPQDGNAQPTPPAPSNPTPQPPAPTPAPPVVEPPAPSAKDLDTTKVLIEDGHVDVGPRVVDNALVMVLKDDTRTFANRTVLRDPAAVTLAVPAQAKITRSDRYFGDEAFNFLGEKGTPLYVLSASQIDGRPWPGFSTEEINYDQFPNGVTLDLIPETAPKGGRWWGFTSSTFSGFGQMIFDSAQPMRLDLARRTHMHLNWVFNKPGTYTMKVAARPTPAEGGAPAAIAPSKFTTVTFVVDQPTNGTPQAGPSMENPIQNSGTDPKHPSTDKDGAGKTGGADKQEAAQAGDTGAKLQGTVLSGKQGAGTPAGGGSGSDGKVTGGKSGSGKGGKLASTGAQTLTLVAMSSLLTAAGMAALRRTRFSKR